MTKVFKHPDGVIKGKGLDVFEFGDLGLNVDELPDIPNHTYPSLNQYLYANTKMACTIVGAYINACYLYEIKPTNTDMLECVNYAHDNCNYQYGKGWFADLGMRAVEKYFERKYNKNLYYSTITWDDPNLIKLLKKGYMLGITYGGNLAYNKDYQVDNMLDGTKFGTATYFHRTSIKYKDNKIYVVDSAGGNTYNVYELKDMPALFQNGVFDETLFVYTKEANFVSTQELSRLVQLRNLTQVVKFNANASIAKTNDPLRQNDLRDIIARCTDELAKIDAAIKNGETITI